MNLETARTQMLGQQIRAWEVFDARVLETLRETPRERFVPEEFRELAFADLEVPLAHGQCMMAPKVEGRLLQALQLESADRVLEVGTGSGYLTACLARLAGEVVTIDIFSDFVNQAEGRLAEHRITNVSFLTGDALSLARPAEFDAIAVTGSVPRVDEHFIRMLRPDGRLFIVVGRAPVMEARLVTMRANGKWTEESLFETVLTPLVNAEQPEPFVL
ncbi:MAG TPA: protein-L-isoaspartate O-methyltransferase [Gammaproteobacteria bacterium]|nr:protein-L-isoaspartate O-methyltransferase [Gammaproteobacteria bacterium]